MAFNPDAGGGGSPTPTPATTGNALMNQALSQLSADNTATDNNVPLWTTRPKLRVRRKYGGTITSLPGSVTKDTAYTSFLDMSQQDRDKFALYALRYGMIKPGDEHDPGAVQDAWGQMVTLASTYNSSHAQSRWISPWEAIHKFAGSRLAGSNGAVNLYRHQVDRTVKKLKFTKEQVQPSLEEIFLQQLGRTPTKREVNIYTKAIQSAYNRHPEVQVSKIDEGPGGTKTVNTISGGIDVAGHLASQVRNTSEADAYQAGVTYMQALEQAIASPVR